MLKNGFEYKIIPKFKQIKKNQNIIEKIQKEKMLYKFK